MPRVPEGHARLHIRASQFDVEVAIVRPEYPEYVRSELFRADPSGFIMIPTHTVGSFRLNNADGAVIGHYDNYTQHLAAHYSGGSASEWRDLCVQYHDRLQGPPWIHLDGIPATGGWDGHLAEMLEQGGYLQDNYDAYFEERMEDLEDEGVDEIEAEDQADSYARDCLVPLVNDQIDELLNLDAPPSRQSTSIITNGMINSLNGPRWVTKWAIAQCASFFTRTRPSPRRVRWRLQTLTSNMYSLNGVDLDGVHRANITFSVSRCNTRSPANSAATMGDISETARPWVNLTFHGLPILDRTAFYTFPFRCQCDGLQRWPILLVA